MQYSYRPQGVCSREMRFDVNDGLLSNVQVIGGCNGNLQGLGRLLEGMPIAEAARRLKGVRCGHKSTSCPDQLAAAFEQAMESDE